jgi:UDP-glucuronate decarboxylase
VVYKKFPLLTIEVAVDGSRRLLEVAHEYGAKYLFTSTSEVLQTPPPECIPTNERYVGAIPTMTDRAPYDVSKALGETLTFTYWRQHGLHAINVRLFNSFGAGMAEKDQRILPRLASSIVAKRALTVYGHDERTLPTRTYCPAANTAYGILLALVKGKPAGLYHIGAPNPEITVPELCKLAARVLGREVPYQLMPPPDVYETEPRRRCPDIGLAQRELGYELVVPLEDGLKSFLSWALSVYTGEGA